MDLDASKGVNRTSPYDSLSILSYAFVVDTDRIPSCVEGRYASVCSSSTELNTEKGYFADDEKSDSTAAVKRFRDQFLGKIREPANNVLKCVSFSVLDTKNLLGESEEERKNKMWTWRAERLPSVNSDLWSWT